MKRKIRFLSMLLALLMLCMPLFGCNKDQNSDGQTSDSDAQTTSGEPTFRLNDVAMTEYTIVYNGTSGKQALVYFNSKMNQAYKIQLESTTTVDDGNQIFIGVVGNDASVIEFFESCEGGMIGFDGKSVYLLAKDSAGLFSVIDAFFAKAAADGADTVVTVSENENIALTTDSLTVMSYNVLYDMYYDDAKKLPRDMDALAEFIKSQSADVFGTQETLDEHKEAILKAMPNYDCYKGIKLRGAWLSNMIFWNADKYKKVESGFQYLTDTPFVESKIPESNSYRGFSYVVLESLVTHKQFLVVDVHITYRGSDGEASGSIVKQARLKQAQYLVKFLENKKYEAMPIILVGDFNSVPGSDALNVVEDSARIDRTVNVANSKGDVGGTIDGSQHTVRQNYVFDHIFVTSDRITTEYYTAVDQKVNGRYPSDHLPVIAKLVIY